MKSDGERLAVLEEKVDAITKKIGQVEISITGLHTKMDAFILTLSREYVSVTVFDEYKKSRTLDRLLTVVATATITGLISYFISRGGI